jgi:Domain of unknown function (DUF6250)
MKRTASTIAFMFGSLLLSAQDSLLLPYYRKGELLYTDDFRTGLQQWIVESPVTTAPKIDARNGRLAIEVTGGATVWFRKKLSGNYLIECRRKVIVAGGPYDRLSDLNVFWSATDPRSQNLFTRTGVLEEYDSLKLYYVGMGGNSNRTTRFRKYEGNGNRTLLQEYTDAEHLLEANREYLVQIVAYKGTTEVFLNGQKFFSYHDEEPLTEGWFGIRTTKSHHEVTAFRVYRLN